MPFNLLAQARNHSDAMERTHRLRQLEKLNEFKRCVPHVSGRALTAILSRVREHGMPERLGRRDQQEGRDLVAYQNTPYGPLQSTVQLRGASAGTTVPLEMANPLAIIHVAAGQSGSFAHLLKEKLIETPPSYASPWHLIMYSDGITPGDAFKTGNDRKVETVYFSLQELGMNALCHEDAWFTQIAKRSSDVDLVGGGMSQIFGACLRAFFGPLHNVRDSGMLLTFADGTRIMLFLSLSIVVQDELAHKMIWMCKGASGLRSCMLCLDHVEGDSTLTEFDATNYLRSEISDPNELRMHNDATVRAIMHRLRTRKAIDLVGAFEQRETALGFTYSEHSILLDDSLARVVRPVSQYMHDWMHVVMQGVFQLVMYLVLEVVRADHDIRYNKLHDYIQLWKWPRRLGNSAKHVFDAKHETSSRKAKSLKCSASEGLAVFLVIAHYFRMSLLPSRHITKSSTDAIGVFLALVVVIELLQNVPRQTVSPDTLRLAVRAFIQAFANVFGWAPMITKFHSLLHLVKEYMRHGLLITCWVHERKHKTIKRYAGNIMNGTPYERSLLSEVTSHHLVALQNSDAFDFSIGLINARPPSRRLKEAVAEIFRTENVREALETRYDAFSTCGRGDVVLVRDGEGMVAGDVWSHLEIEGIPVSLIDVYEPLDVRTDQQYCTWRVRHNPMFYESDSIITAVIWSRTGDVVTTLLPRR